MYWTFQTREQKNTHVLEIPSSPNAGRRDGLSGVTALNLLEPNTSLGKTPPGPPPLTDVSAVVVVVGTLPPGRSLHHHFHPRSLALYPQDSYLPKSCR